MPILLITMRRSWRSPSAVARNKPNRIGWSSFRGSRQPPKPSDIKLTPHQVAACRANGWPLVTYADRLKCQRTAEEIWGTMHPGQSDPGDSNV
jgi:hypothetical protein